MYCGEVGSAGQILHECSLVEETAGDALSSRFEKEPRASFGLIDPNFDKASGCVIVNVCSDFVGGPQAFHEGSVVSMKLLQHLRGAHEFLIVVGEPLQTSDVTDGADG